MNFEKTHRRSRSRSLPDNFKQQITFTDVDDGDIVDLASNNIKAISMNKLLQNITKPGANISYQQKVLLVAWPYTMYNNDEKSKLLISLLDNDDATLNTINLLEHWIKFDYYNEFGSDDVDSARSFSLYEQILEIYRNRNDTWDVNMKKRFENLKNRLKLCTGRTDQRECPPLGSGKCLFISENIVNYYGDKLFINKLSRMLTYYSNLHIRYITLTDMQKNNGTVSKAVCFFNGLTDWVSNEILNTETKLRYKTIELFINVAHEFLKYNCFFCIQAFAYAINSHLIYRLDAWKRVRESCIEKITIMRELVSSSHNYKLYKQKLRECSGPIVPMLSVLQKEFTAVMENSYIHPVEDENLLNWTNMKIMAKVFLSFLHYNNTSYTSEKGIDKTTTENKMGTKFLDALYMKKIEFDPHKLPIETTLICEKKHGKIQRQRSTSFISLFSRRSSIEKNKEKDGIAPVLYRSPEYPKKNENTETNTNTNTNMRQSISIPVLTNTSNDNVIKMLQKRIRLQGPNGTPVYNIRMPQMNARNVAIAFRMDRDSIYLQDAKNPTILEYPNEHTGVFDYLSENMYIVFDKNTPAWTPALPNTRKS